MEADCKQFADFGKKMRDAEKQHTLHLFFSPRSTQMFIKQCLKTGSVIAAFRNSVQDKFSDNEEEMKTIKTVADDCKMKTWKVTLKSPTAGTSATSPMGAPVNSKAPSVPLSQLIRASSVVKPAGKPASPPSP
jgi:hypothetical protein